MLCVLKCVISSSTSSPWKPHNLRFLILCSSFIFNIQAWVVPAVQSLTQLNKPILHNVAFKGSLSYWWFLVFTLIVSVTTDIKNPQSGWGLAVTQKRWKGRTEDPFLRRGWDGRSAGEKRRWMLGGRSEESSVGEGWDQLREEVMLSVHLKSAEKVSLSAFYRLSSLLSVGEWVSPSRLSSPLIHLAPSFSVYPQLERSRFAYGCVCAHLLNVFNDSLYSSELYFETHSDIVSNFWHNVSSPSFITCRMPVSCASIRTHTHILGIQSPVTEWAQKHHGPLHHLTALCVHIYVCVCVFCCMEPLAVMYPFLSIYIWALLFLSSLFALSAFVFFFFFSLYLALSGFRVFKRKLQVITSASCLYN